MSTNIVIKLAATTGSWQLASIDTGTLTSGSWLVASIYIDSECCEGNVLHLVVVAALATL